MLKRVLLFLVAASVISSCEGIVGDEADVYDTKTQQPLKDVKVIHYLDDRPHDTTFTDNKGTFDAGIFVGCVPECPTAKVVLSKEGFHTVTYVFKEKKGKKKPKRIEIFMKRKK